MLSTATDVLISARDKERAPDLSLSLYIYIYTHTYKDVHMRCYIRIGICISLYIYIYIHTYVVLCICILSLSIYIYTYTLTPICMYVFIHAHTGDVLPRGGVRYLLHASMFNSGRWLISVCCLRRKPQTISQAPPPSRSPHELVMTLFM